MADNRKYYYLKLKESYADTFHLHLPGDLRQND